MAPMMQILPHIGLPKAYAIASATGIVPSPDAALISAGADRHVARNISIYHAAAMQMDMISMLGIFFKGTSISLAD